MDAELNYSLNHLYLNVWPILENIFIPKSVTYKPILRQTMNPFPSWIV